MSKMRLSAKLLASFLSVAMIVLVIGLLGIRGEVDMSRHLVSISEECLPAIIQLNRLNFERMRVRAQSYEVMVHPIWSAETKAALQQVSQERKATWTSVDAALAAYDKMQRAPNEEAVYSAFLGEYRTWRAKYVELDRLLQDMVQAGDQAALTSLLAEYGRRIEEIYLISDRTGVLIESMVALKNAAADTQVRDALDGETDMIRLYSLGILIGLVLAVVLGVGITRDTLRQLGGEPAQVLAIVNRLAEGDLRGEIQVRAGDSGSLLAAIARMAANMKHLLFEVSSASAQVAAAASQLSVTSEETREQVRVGQSETDQVATAMNEMLATVEEVARHAAAAAQATEETDKETASGGHVVTQTIAAIESLALEVEAAGQVIERLSDDSREIGAVLDVIRGVAEQTNLLALNAAIEAARAGEQGRGFAVVAAEVRTLASRTQSSIQDIREKIERVQNGSRGAVAVMGKGQAMARESVLQAQQAGASLNAIGSAITSISDMNRQIASAAEEQAAVAEEINRNIHTISGTVAKTSAGSAQIAASSEQLDNLSRQLQDRVGQFRI